MAHIILSIHLLVAVMTLGNVAGVFFSTKKKNFQQAAKRARRMWQATLLTIASGCMLALVSHVPVGRVCASSLGLVAVVLAAQAYQKYFAKKLLV